MSDNLQDWIGRTETTHDVASPVPLAGLAALLDRDMLVGDTVPPLGHWLYFLNRAPQSQIEADGHPRRGGFLPPIPLPRRMWAGSRIEFRSPIAIGAAIEKRSTIAAIEAKTGASGEMIFLTVHHEIASAGGVALREEQDVVFRAAPKGGATKPRSPKPMPQPEWRRTLIPDITQLFRFSALTFNAHRIHYDRNYARDVEGYPGLVVQGPYTAMLLMDLALRHGLKPTRFAFRAQSPHFEGHALSLCGAGGRLWSLDESGAVGMTAEIQPSLKGRLVIGAATAG
jgi:3-methylfumaryl-CoA hydratase